MHEYEGYHLNGHLQLPERTGRGRNLPSGEYHGRRRKMHSQNRGRLFLPFVDEDPKTAEILTKIIFFAEDDKIKDPSILNQIK